MEKDQYSVYVNDLEKLFAILKTRRDGFRLYSVTFDDVSQFARKLYSNRALKILFKFNT